MKGPGEGETAAVVDLAHDGRGVARVNGKAVFIAGALPGETVRFRRGHRHSRHDEAFLVEVLVPAAERCEPPCAAYARCGGCALQHLRPEAQIAAKQRQLIAELERIGHVTPTATLPALTGPELGYRRRARLGVKYLKRSRRVLVGFRERDSAMLANLPSCPVLAAPVGTMLEPLGELIAGLSVPDQIAQIEVAVGDDATVLVLRNLVALTEADRERLAAFEAAHGVQLWLQPGGTATAAPLAGEPVPLSYRLPAFDVTLGFAPLDFVQVNGPLNERMVDYALELLAPGPADAVLDLFCGLGNFTLPIARRARDVLGVEGEGSLVARARDNADRNGIRNARFATANLAADLRREPWARERFDRVLLDPPRAGAADVLPFLGQCGAARIVYISCHPATLARDAGLLVREQGFTLAGAGVMDMFPHTAHVESIAVFERTP